MRLLLLASVCMLAALGTARLPGGEKIPLVGKVVRLDPAFDKLFAKDAAMQKLAGGCKWTEGPVWIKEGGYLLFSDIPNNTINKWHPDKGLTRDFIKPAGYTGKKDRGGEPGTNGLTTDADGRLTCCEHGDRRVTRIEKDGKKVVLADKYMGKRFNSPNDLVYASNGDLYFTDPPYGLEKNWDDPARELDFCGVYLLRKSGELVLLTKEMSRPNGITLAPDGKTLYVANSDPKIAIWKSFPVKNDGTIGDGKVFFDATKWVEQKKPGLPDGLRVDVNGNLFATGPGGVIVLSPTGTHLGTLDTGVPTANCAFGGDGTWLYITANNDLLRIPTLTKGKGF